MTSSPTSKFIRAGVVLLVLALGIAIFWALHSDPVATLRRNSAALERLERRAAPELGERVERWRMITVAGDTLSALWHAASLGTDRAWTVVLLGGLVAGERAALLVPDDAATNVLAVDWPWRESRRMPWWRIVVRLGAIRHALLHTPGVLAVGVEAAARSPEVDPGRIALIGVSLGVPPAVSCLRLTRRPAALVLLHGGADLREQLRHGLVGEGVPGPLAFSLSVIGSRLIHPLEPSLHAEAAGSRPVLVINAVTDPLLPRASVARLHELFPTADVRWNSALHGAKDRRAAIAESAHEVEAWLAAMP